MEQNILKLIQYGNFFTKLIRNWRKTLLYIGISVLNNRFDCYVISKSYGIIKTNYTIYLMYKITYCSSCVH